MGELSKMYGEYGERTIIDNFIPDILGWRGSSNLGFRCHLKKKHDKQTHDIDFFSTYTCPLISETEQIIYCSIKYTAPKNIKSDFKKFSKNIFDAYECFKISHDYNRLTEEVGNKKRIHTLILFWINHKENSEFDLIKEIGTANSELSFDFDKIYLIDNKKLNFIFQAKNFAKLEFPESLIECYYPNTGLNETIYGGRAISGNIIPVEFINSSVIPFKITTKDNKKILLIASNENIDEDTLKRITGLSQNLSGGWCNKIILCFPDYRAKDHSFLQGTVMSKFKENNFSDMIEIRSFNMSITKFEAKENDNYLENIETTHEFNIEKMLPFGDQIRQLLTQSYINKNDMQQLMSRRGIYINRNQSKEELIPLFMKTIISPSEFEFLRRKHAGKANAESISADQITTSNDTDLSEIISGTDIPIEDIVKKINPNIEIISKQAFHFQENGAIKLRLETKEKQYTKDWAKTDIKNHLEIIVRPQEIKGDFSKSRIDIVSTNKDSKNIAKEILAYCVEDIKKKGRYLQPELTVKKTLATEFNNLNRTKLLFSFIDTTADKNPSIQFRDITYIEFNISEKANNLPEDIETLKNKVEQSILSGHNLQDIKYITDSKYHDVLLFTIINAEFNFVFQTILGKFEVQYGFPDFKDNIEDKSEFEFKILHVHPFTQKNLSKQENLDLEYFLKEQFNILKWKKINAARKKYGEQLPLF